MNEQLPGNLDTAINVPIPKLVPDAVIAGVTCRNVEETSGRQHRRMGDLKGYLKTENKPQRKLAGSSTLTLKSLLPVKLALSFSLDSCKRHKPQHT